MPAAADLANIQPPLPVLPPVDGLAEGSVESGTEIASASAAVDPARPSLPASLKDGTVPGREQALEDVAARSAMPPAVTPAVAAATTAILPALQAFGAALHRAVTAERGQSARDVSPDALVAALAAAPTATAATPAPAAAIDTGQPQWLETMVSRIEQLRDAVSGPGTLADTRIRLRPDALGTVDVTVRREGDGIHAHFTAAEPATARLLADSQPRLAELAQARGLRLTQAGVDGGAPGNAGGQSDRRQPAHAPEASRPPRAASSSPAEDSVANDRLA